MRVTIRQKNLEITPALRVYIESKIIRPLRRLLGRASTQALPILDLEFGRMTRHHRKGKVYRAEANLTFGGKMLRAEAYGEDIRACCDILEEGILREFTSYQQKKRAVELRRGRREKKDFRFDPAARLYRKGRIRHEGN